MNQPLPATYAEALDALADAEAHIRAAEVARIVAVARAADLYRVDQAGVWDAMDDCLSPASDATGSVGEFLAHEIGAILGVSPSSAICTIGEVLAVRDRFPTLWATFLRGELRWWQITQVITRPAVTHLTDEAASWLDHRISVAMRTWPWQRIRSHIERWAIEADPVAAAEREQHVREQRYVWVDGVKDGHCTLYGRLSPRDAVDFDHALTSIAHTLPTEQGSMDQRRAAAVGMLSRQSAGQDTLPDVTLVVHIDADDPALTHRGSSGVAEVEKWGPLLTSRLPEFLKDSKVTVRPVIDPWRLPAEDQHDPSVALRTAVMALMPVDMFPYGSVPARNCDIDHTLPHREGVAGQTRWGNLAPLSRRAHRAKTFGGWTMSQPEPGVVLWTSPGGFQYLVTSKGTCRISRPERPVRVEEPPPPWLEPPGPPDDPPVETTAWEWIQHTLTT